MWMPKAVPSVSEWVLSEVPPLLVHSRPGQTRKFSLCADPPLFPLLRPQGLQHSLSQGHTQATPPIRTRMVCTGRGESTLQLSHPDVQCPASHVDWLRQDDFIPQFTNACLFNYHLLPFFLLSFPTTLSTLMSSHDPFHILIKTAIIRKKKVIFKA